VRLRGNNPFGAVILIVLLWLMLGIVNIGILLGVVWIIFLIAKAVLS
jgi:hypothetical protein